mgnify:FL=1
MGIDITSDIKLELLPPPLQFKIRKAANILRKLYSLKNMITVAGKKKLIDFNKSQRIKETEEYKFEYEKLEKEYLAILDEIAKELANYLQSAVT